MAAETSKPTVTIATPAGDILPDRAREAVNRLMVELQATDVEVELQSHCQNYVKCKSFGLV